MKNNIIRRMLLLAGRVIYQKMMTIRTITIVSGSLSLLQRVGLLGGLLAVSLAAFGQTSGDYQTRATGNWNANTTWQVYNGAAWVNCGAGDYPGVAAGAGNVTILGANNVTINADVPNSIGSLAVDGTLVGSNNNTVRTLTISGNLSVSNSYNIRAGNLTVGGTTSVDGNLFDNNANGSNTFVGLVTVNAAGQWNIPYSCTFRGGLTVNSSSFTSTGATYTFNTNNQSISGTQSFTITNLACGTAGRTVTNENTNGLTIAGNISGAGNFTNGSVANNAILYLTLTGNPFTLAGTLDLATNPNTVNYAGTVAQTIAAYNFYNLTSSSTGARTLANGGTVGISDVFTPGTNAYTVTNNTINFNGLSAQSIPSFTFNNLTVSGGTIKTLIGAATVQGIVNLNTGVLELDNFNLTVTNNATNAIQTPTSFSSTNMIGTNGTGSLVRNGAATLPQTYPIGSGGFYSPATISALTTTAPLIRVRAIPTALNTSFINKYWDITISGGVITNATATFQYDPGELNGALPSISYSPDGGVSWQNPPATGAPSFGANSFTITGTSSFLGWWTMGYKTFYSYQTGNWGTFSTWTSDPSGTLQIGSTIPSNNDKVIILSGRTVSFTADIATLNLDVTINEGGFLDIATWRFTNPLSALRGQGTFKLASVNFPTATINTLVNAGGGTVEYNAGVNLPAAQATYNNLTINTAGTVVQVSNILLNGDLYVQQGTFQINDNTANRRTLTINGNVTVDNGAFVIVGTGVTNTTTNPTAVANGGVGPFINYYDTQSHRIVVYGDFTNNGTVKFTNIAYPVYNAFPPIVLGATTGFATVYFMGTTDNTLSCGGATDFYNLVLDKGTDQTYKLTINPTSYSNFRLFGANNAGYDIGGATDANPNIKKALWVRNGTLVLDGFTVIPSLSEGTCSGVSSDFFVPANGALVLDNQNVVVLESADDYHELNAAYGVAAPSNAAAGIGVGGCSSFSINGKLQINDGYFSARESGGFITWDYASGQLIINGGTVDAKQFRAAGGAGGLASFQQTGGTFILRGRFQRNTNTIATVSDIVNATMNTARAVNGTDGTFGTFNLNAAANVFAMSGGTIQIYDVCGAGGRAFEVFSSSGNINVTGGLLDLIPTAGTVIADAATWLISSNASLWNMTITRPSSTSIIQVNAGYPLTVQNNLTINSSELQANSLNLKIGGNFTIANGALYTPGTNTTIFNGSGAQTLTVNTAAALVFKKFKVDKPAGTTLTLAGSQTTINVSDSLMIIKGTLADGGKTIDFVTSATTTTSYIYNSGIHSGAGKIRLSDDDPQVIDGDDLGVFGNLELNNTDALAAPVSLASSITINGALTFSQNKLFNIGAYNLKLNSTASFVSAGANRYVQTAGNLGDGGITRVYPNSTAFVFPFGAVSTRHAAPAYTPASIGFTGTPTVYGSITINPVGYEHPTTTTNGRSLTYFWRVKSSGFTIGSATVTHGYTYDQADVVTGGDVTEPGYVAARYNSSTYSWTRGVAADVDETNNIIGEPGGGSFLENVAFIDGDYTAGDDNATNPFGTPTIYYSRQTGTWGTATNWSLTSHTVTNPPAVAPSARDIVIIGNGHTISFETPANYLTNPNTSPHSCASLQIETGATLDTRFNPSSTFSVVRSHPNGNGVVRVAFDYDSPSTLAFPGGDFSDFNQNLGTTELYSTNPFPGTEYYMPNGVLTYGNLILSPSGGSNIMFPNNNLTIYGNLTTYGQNADSWFCPTWDGNYPTAPTARIAKTITINGNLDIQGGALVWYGNGAITQNVVVHGDVIVAPNSAIDVWSGATSQNLSIGGNLINNTVGTIAGGTTTPRRCDFTLLPVTFFGNSSTSITNTLNNPVTIFERMTVNKGTSQSTTLTLNIGGTLTTPTNNWLTLQNGTLRYMRTNPATDFTITTTSPFTIPSTAGLYIDYSNTGGTDVLIADNASNTNDLYLNGKLTLIRGNVYVGQVAAPNNDNDIEYSGGGASAIEVQGGQLIVNGQIRRNLSSTVGILSYNQSGGAVTINGRGNAATSARGKLEVLNPGSVFNMSGASSTITIVRGGGTTYGDLYLRPGASSITDGTIIFAHNISGGNQSYLLDANIPLNNLTITGRTAATAANASVGLMVSPLVLNGSLTLTNANSILNSNNRNITIKGNMSNNGTYNYGTNLTTFSGNTQTITGTSTTNFYDLTVSPVLSLTPNSSFTVNRNLIISAGSLVLGNRKLTLKGNLTNNSSYTDDNTTGGISLAGTALQQIYGTGAYGKLEVNNGFGARLNNDLMLQNDLLFTQGALDINQYLLTLGLTSNIGGSGFGTSKMILSDGVSSSGGVRKFFPVTAATILFTYPIGVIGKYTPVSLTINANGSVGYINVNPINNNHPAVVDATQVLKYYWEIESSGISGFDGSLLFQYLASDVQGVESNYVAAKLLTPGTYWSKATPGPLTDNVDETNHQISFTIPIGSNDVTGDYTAGIDIALPDEVPSYMSNKDGDWTDNTIWDPIGSSPPCPVGGPNGFNVVVKDIVTTNTSYCFSYHTTVNGTLKVVSPTFGHNLGTVDGNGIIYLEGGNLPAGNFVSFLDCAIGGTLEYGGTGNYTIIASQYSTVPYLFFTGSGTRTLPAKDLTICNRLVIDGPTLDNNTNKRKLTILGTMERLNTGAFVCGSGVNAIISFSGSALQTIGGALGDFTGTNRIYSLEINNSNGLNIGNSGTVEVGGYLYLTNGIINTTSSNKLYMWSSSPATVIPSGGSSTSFVNGPMYKYISAGSNFLYPIGKGTAKGHNFTITSTAGVSLYWIAEYFTPNPTATSLTSPLQASNTKEYWSVSNASGSYTARVKIGWDPMSDLTPSMTVNGLPDMRVAEYNGGTSSWEEKASTTTGDANNGDVATTVDLSISTTPKNYTVASITNTKPKASLNPSGPVCGAAGIPIMFSTFSPISLNYTLDYTVNGTPQPTVNVTALPYTLPTPSPGAYKLTGFTYNNGANTGVVDASVVNAYAIPTTANAGLDQSLCGLSGVTLAGNNPAPFTGLWSIQSGSGGIVLTPTAYNSVFNGISGSTYTLRWTISSGTCTSSDDVVIAFPVAPQRPSSFISAPTPVCQGSNGNIYTVGFISGVIYNWSYSGSGETINGSGNSITIDFNGTATSGTLSVTTTNGCGTSLPRTTGITVNPRPVFTISGLPASACDGNLFTLTTDFTSIVTPYTIDIRKDGSSVSGYPLSGQSADPYDYNENLVWVGPGASNTFSYSVTVTSANGCSSSSASPVSVTVYKMPETGPEYHIPNTFGF